MFSAAVQWDALRLAARDLGFAIAENAGSGPRGVTLTRRRSRAGTAAARRVAAADLASIRLENDWLVRTCRDYVDALTRAGNALGLGGWVVVSECSGVLLEVSAMRPAPEPGSRRPAAPEPGDILSLAVAGRNPVGLALDRAAVAILPFEQGGGAGGGTAPRFPSPLWGIGIPLGSPPVPVGCLAVLVCGPSPDGVYAILSQALFSARAVELGLALRHEREANLEVATGMAHEVRNPLAAVKGFLELTLAHRTEVPEFAGVALRELDRAISLLEDYSLFSRAPRIAPAQMVSVDGLLAETVLVARGLAASGPPVTISYLGSDPDLNILADPPRLKQVLLNLCRNAVEAMPEGGVLTLRGRRGSGEVIIEVADTGVGIPLSEVGRLFEPFYTTKSNGTGLGLAVCRRVVEAHGGRITFESAPGRGSVFRLHLPFPY